MNSSRPNSTKCANIVFFMTDATSYSSYAKNMFSTESLSIVKKSVDKLENTHWKHCLANIC